MRTNLKRGTAPGLLFGLALMAVVSCDSAEMPSDPTSSDVDAEAALRLRLPSAVTDLRVLKVTSTTITVGWTAVSDGRGGAAKYALRASAPPMNWNAAAVTEMLVAAKPVGELVTHTIAGVPPTTKFELQLVSYRGDKNTRAVAYGPRSNIVAGQTLATDSVPTQPADTVAKMVTATPASHAFTALGATAQITAVAKNAAGTTLQGARFVYTSTNTGVVSVDANGLMTARGAGNANVVVKSATSTAADTVAVTVTINTAPAVARVIASPSSVTLTAVGQTAQLSATAQSSAGATVSATFNWSSTNTSIATVDANGRVTARAAGTAGVIVKASCCAAADTVPVTVQVTTPPPPSGGTPLFSDGFESGNLSRSTNGVSWTSSTRTAVTSERAYSGNYSLRFRYQAAANGKDSHSEQRFRLPNIVPEIWMEWMLYVPSNFVIRDQDHFENNKIWSLWAGDYSTNRLIDTELTMEYFRQTNTEGTTRLSVAHGDANASTGRNDHERNDMQAALFTADTRGKWIRIRVYAKLDKAGVVRMWRDNQLVYELANWNLWGTGGINRFESGYLMGWANSGFAQETDFYVDDFKVYNTNPGWR